ncbi:hypothetical protein FIBSPDRAFT_868386 [Athelia psychrophila]|uniref:Uncharacterized protein n=1 Tax=Athelia psychrophila TaxID=1759441 RepID=A0A167WI09_9AGAM|nr:hypothetical protein FIBSPDRAFT_876820 [Fibularhizoctonia sp. CBS 109695]KZP14278.1 hypothetical protein FIBSPDRAFT_868386 [Fibularhizoctonia sp. CBS 109695]
MLRLNGPPGLERGSEKISVHTQSITPESWRTPQAGTCTLLSRGTDRHHFRVTPKIWFPKIWIFSHCYLLLC